MKKFLSLALALTMALTLAACGGKTDTPPADTNDGSTAGQTGGKLVVYSALNEDNTIAIADQFKKDTGIEIEYISLGGGDAVARVQAEMANPKADILVGGSVDLYGSLADAGAFEAYDSPNNDSLDARFNDPNHFWQGWYMGVLSIIINEERFEKELAPKGVKMPETWDDLLDPNYESGCIRIPFAKSERAAERLLESCRKYLEGRLKLKMNAEKSKVTSIFAQKKFKFLGFCLGRTGSGTYIRVHRKSLAKAKEKLKLLTKRNRGRNVRRVMQEVKEFIRGWIGYFRAADMKRTLMSWDKWMRRRFRMYIWKQWKKPKTKVANLRKLGVPADKAYRWGNSRLGYWRIAGSHVLKCSITNERLAAAGYFSILNYYESLHSCG